ncbi:hypothetical protein EWM64_g4755 [Hericium alpestre]|uniref:Uncharacterized protein n=1 Tax=Hericium alpestre TaxID=135208 RepID=A0A4Z0A0N9_9AGAM|nr:hypothetical protein EWM64_g4755 [Hericium alpestre]
MSLTRVVLAAAHPRPPIISCAQRRFASTDSHTHDVHHQSTDEHYPREGAQIRPTSYIAPLDLFLFLSMPGFNSRIWAYTVLAGLGVVGFYKFAPSSGEDNFISKYIAHYRTPKEVWENWANKHLEFQTQVQENTFIIQHAKLPPVHVYRFPQALDQASPFNVAVGGDVDISNIKVKSDKDL